MSDLPALDDKARASIWYFVEDVFGKVEHDAAIGQPFWNPDWDLFEERIRKRLQRFKLVNRSQAPLAVKSFIQGSATDHELIELLSTVPALVFETSVASLGESRATSERSVRAKQIEDLLSGLGIDATFDPDGTLRVLVGVDSSAKDLGALPKHDDFERDLADRINHGHRFSLLFVDLDNFKIVNDRNGHPAGDRCLAHVARILGSVAAGRGRLYRYGGDEFAAILLNFTTAEATATAERIRQVIEQANPGDDVRVTASIGVAEFGQDLSTTEQLIAAADDAASASKAQGKNAVTAWPLDGRAAERLREYRAAAKGRG